jgi:hypothetical protein
MGYRPPWVDPKSVYVEYPHPSMLEEKELLEQCEVSFGRSSGPGGQHRNKVETGVRIVHPESGIEARATERREQRVNRSKAIFRMRMKLAVKVRTATGRDNHRPTVLWVQRRQGTKLPVSGKHEDYPALLAEALDVITARKYDVAGAAGILGVTMSQLTRLLRQEAHVLARVNQGRESVGLPRLRS